jgi:glycosyltransferase involved in cell wall biosynthesis
VSKNDPLVLHTRVVTGTGGGPEKTIFNSTRFLDSFGFSVLCAYMHPPGDPGFEELRRRAEAAGVPLVGIEDRGPLDLRVVRRMLEICRREHVAIWHAHDYKSNAIGLLLRRFWPMRLVTTVHGWVQRTRRTPIYYWIDRLVLRRYERVICVSEDLHQTCLRSKVPADRCTCIENAIDTQQYARHLSVEEAKRRLGLAPGRLLAGSVGRLSAEKNFAGLIQAVDRLIGQRADLDLVIIGEGGQRQELEALIGQLGRGDRIRLLGYRPDMIDLYQAMDVFVLSSIREGLPNVLLEAMAMEVPVVATRIAGVPRLVEHEANGLLVEPGNVDDLARGMKRLLEQPGLRQCLAAAGRRTVEERYSFDVRMAKVRKIYGELLHDSNERSDGR